MKNVFCEMDDLKRGWRENGDLLPPTSSFPYNNAEDRRLIQNSVQNRTVAMVKIAAPTSSILVFFTKGRSPSIHEGSKPS